MFKSQKWATMFIDTRNAFKMSKKENEYYKLSTNS